jgi:hypothetical protein
MASVLGLQEADRGLTGVPRRQTKALGRTTPLRERRITQYPHPAISSLTLNHLFSFSRTWRGSRRHLDEICRMSEPGRFHPAPIFVKAPGRLELRDEGSGNCAVGVVR